MTIDSISRRDADVGAVFPPPSDLARVAAKLAAGAC